MPGTTQEFKGWLKISNNMKLSSDGSVLRLNHEDITNFVSLHDFDKNIIENFTSLYKSSVVAIESDDSKNISA